MSLPFYEGNPRNISTDLNLSQKGECQAFAKIAIETLRSPNQDEDNILSKPYETYLCENKDCPQNETKSFLKKASILGSRIQGAFKSKVNLKAEDAALTYISALTEQMVKEYPDKQTEINELVNILTQLTLADPSKRITMEEARQKFPLKLLQKTTKTSA